MCKISVILPSLNVARYIGEAIMSVREQTLEDIEIICVDAGSTDGTLDIIRSHMEADSRVQLIVSDRKSYGYQMNLGMARAKGKYIGIVETDDYIPREMYEELCAAADEANAQVVKADFYRFIEKDGRIQRTYNRLDPTGAYYGRAIHPAKEQEVFRFIMNTWSGVYLRSFLEENGIAHNETPGASYQDNGFWMRTFCCAERVLFVDKPYYRNRRDNADSSVKNPGKVYCMSEEWTDIERWLRRDTRRWDTFCGVFALRLYHSLLFTYQRIAPEFREEFARHMSAEMGRLMSEDVISREKFTAYEWKRLEQLVRDPMAWHSVLAAGCWHGGAAALAKKAGGAAKLIRTADHIANKIEIVLAWIGYEGLGRTMRRVKWKNTVDTVDRER